MRRRSRVRRVLKWVGTAACALIVAISALSGWYLLRFSPKMAFKRDWLGGEAIPNNYEAIYVADGDCRVRWVRWSERETFACRHQGPAATANEPEELPTLWVERFHNPPRFHSWLPHLDNSTIAQPVFSLPLWIPLLFVLLPTLYLWRLDRRFPLRRCQKCDYDLTGNVSAVCPECGMAFAREGETA